MTIKHTPTLTRRQTLAGMAAGVSMSALSACTSGLANTGGLRANPADGNPLLDEIAYNLLMHEPERATSLGVDTGTHARLRSMLEDQSPDGQQAYAATLRRDLARVRAADTQGFTPETRTSFEVVESAYATALDGFALPYGDVAVGSWRNAPYVVIQNVGSYLDLPRFMDSVHPLQDSGDVDAFASRLQAIPAVLDGELIRMNRTTEMGVIPPDFLLDKAVAQMGSTLDDARNGVLFIAQMRENLARNNLPAAPADALTPIVTGPIAAALERQLAELRRQRTMATSEPGMWARPQGDEWYAWALRASTTTPLSADEVHERGLE